MTAPLAPIATLFRDALRRELGVPDLPAVDRSGSVRHRRADPPARQRRN